MKTNRITGTLHEDQCRVLVSCSFLLRIRYISEKSWRISNHILCLMIFFSEILAVYEITYRRVWYATDDVCYMLTACWITKPTKTVIIYKMRCFSTAIIAAPTRLNITLYVHCLSCCA